MAQAKKPAAKKAAPKQKVEPTVSYEETTASAPAKAKVEDTWEIKDRVYILTTNKTPLLFTLPSRHTSKRPLMFYDETLEYERELRYATNQKSPFADEQEGHVTLGHIALRDGTLVVPKEKQALQKLLSLYHPLRGKLYEELDNKKEAEADIDYMDLELDAMTAAAGMDIDAAEAILRVEYGSKVAKMSSKEIKRDLRLFARNNPHLFLELANDDNVQLRNIGIKAAEMGILKLSQDQRTFTWENTGRKVMTVPFGENPYSALAAFFKTDEGVEVYTTIEKRIG
jgi:hypothetical protein